MATSNGNDTKDGLMPMKNAEVLPLLVHASKSFRFRCLVDAREEIMRSGVLSDGEYVAMLKVLLDQELLKAKVLKHLEQAGEETSATDLLSSASKDESIQATDLDVLAAAYQLVAEGFVKSTIKEDREPLFVHASSNADELPVFYVPVSVIEEAHACSGCSACQVACPVDCINVDDGRVKIDMDKCIRCGLCYTACPRSFLPRPVLEWAAGKGYHDKNQLKVATFLEAWSATTTNDAIKEVRQDGGVVSSLALHALNSGRVTAVAGAAMKDGIPWKPEPIVMRSAEDVLRAAGTKYVNTPTLQLLQGLKGEAGKVGFVGTPCMMQALEKARLWPTGTMDVGAVAYKIGIFCMESFTHAGIEHLATKVLDCQLDDVVKMDINMGKFFMTLRSGEQKSVEMGEIAKLARMGCHCCHDLTSEQADISVGSIGSRAGWNTVLVRTSRGKELFDSAVEAGLIERVPLDEVKPGLGLLEKLSFRKKRAYESEQEKRVANKGFHPLYDLKLPPKPVKKPKPA